MILLRQFTPVLNNSIRYLTKKSATVNKKAMKQVHEELMRYINPTARINIRTDIRLTVRSTNVHDFPDGNVFIAELHGHNEKNCSSSMDIKVSDDEKQVDVTLAKIADQTDFHCELSVPIRASLNIQSKNSVSVANMYCEELCVDAQEHINTNEIRAGNITLKSAAGNINCARLLLAEKTTIETNANGNIALDKLKGNTLACKTVAGNINTNSCYVDKSTFETDTGSLKLKNVHKEAKVVVHKTGALNMTGINGNININVNDGNVNLQVAELHGENIVCTGGSDETVINISDAIEENSYIEINSAGVTLHTTLSHLSDCLDEDAHKFCLTQERDNLNKLKVTSKGSVLLGKLSWADTMRAALEANKQ